MSETQQDQDFIVSEAIGKTENFINQNKNQWVHGLTTQFLKHTNEQPNT